MFYFDVIKINCHGELYYTCEPHIENQDESDLTFELFYGAVGEMVSFELFKICEHYFMIPF